MFTPDGRIDQKSAANYLINLIESGQPSDLIRKQAQELVYELHGNAQLETMPPGGAALYLCALIVREL